MTSNHFGRTLCSHFSPVEVSTTGFGPLVDHREVLTYLTVWLRKGVLIVLNRRPSFLQDYVRWFTTLSPHRQSRFFGLGFTMSGIRREMYCKSCFVLISCFLCNTQRSQSPIPLLNDCFPNVDKTQRSTTTCVCDT